MKEQNFKNHSRYVPGFHLITFGLSLTVLVLGIRSFIRNLGSDNEVVTAWIPALTGLALPLICWYARAFALKAQDRAIRAEENLRYFILTGKPLPGSLRMSQIVALRFASDNEFAQLAQKATTENLSSAEIKRSVQHWKADHNRV